MMVTLDDDVFGSLAYWEQVELKMRAERDDEPVMLGEWKKMRISAAKAWIESNNKDFSLRKKHDIRNPRKGRAEV